MSFDYAATRAIADGLLAQFGQTLTIVKAVNQQYDPATGTMEPIDEDADGEVVQDCIGVVLNYSDNDRMNSDILTGDRKVIFSVGSLGGVRPAVGDKVEIGAGVFSIINLAALEPAGTSVIYTAQVRK